MRLLAPGRSWVLLLALVAAGDAAALSRAMWAEFNAIYLVNLKPTAECSPYRTRSLDLLKDGSIKSDELDARMRALWREAKPSCLQPLRDLARAGARTQAASVTVATAARVAPSPPQVSAAPASAPSESAASGAPAAAGSAPEGVAVRAAEEAPPPAPAIGVARPTPAAAPASAARVPASPPILPSAARAPLPGVKPPIERPALADLRLEAACAKRNPYAYQVQSDDDPCVRLARSRAAVAEALAAPTVKGPAAVTTAAIALAIVAAAAAAALWLVWRRRLRRDSTPPVAATAPCDADLLDEAAAPIDGAWAGRVPA